MKEIFLTKCITFFIIKSKKATIPKAKDIFLNSCNRIISKKPIRFLNHSFGFKNSKVLFNTQVATPNSKIKNFFKY